MAERCDVLVIDDEPVVRSGIARVLAATGMTVIGCSDMSSALAHPALDVCRLVLCDLVLPDGSGVDALHSIRRRRSDVPVVIITGYATPESTIRAQESGAAGFLSKPFDEDELLAVVRRLANLNGKKSGGEG
jgi:DNA-binding NtrC family response regulator